MLKAVNMKAYRFGKLGNIRYTGFGILNTESGKFLAHNGHPYVLRTKLLAQNCIDNHFENIMRDAIAPAK